MGVEQSWHNEVKQGPQFLHVILNWRTGQQKTIAAAEPKQILPSRTRRGLDSLSFIKNHVLPLHLLEVLRVKDDKLVRRDEDMEF